MAESITDLSSSIGCEQPVWDKCLLLRHDHSPARNEASAQVGKVMQFRLYNPDPAFGIDITKFKVRFNAGSWYEYGNSRLTFTEVSYREYRVFFNPPSFDYDSQINVELYCADHLNNKGILLEIL